MSQIWQHLNNRTGRGRSGIVLLVTLVLLVVLSILGYTLSSRIAAQRHRDQYIMDYSKARYACDSAVKYALATLEDLNPQLISRPNEPDFSDLFLLSEPDYQQLLTQWAAQLGITITEKNFKDVDVRRPKDFKDANDSNDVNDFDDVGTGSADVNDSNSLEVPGPYGPVWPLVTKPSEFEIGSATVRIEIEDEEAKYPLGWALLDDAAVQREARASFETFCEWMGIEAKDTGSLKEELKAIGEIKPFKIEFSALSVTEKTAPAASPTGSSPSARSRTSTVRRAVRTPVTRRTISAADQLTRQGAEFSELFHSSLIDREFLARPFIISDTRKESALKYMGIWGSTRVNINSAPRHVLEAAFTFGGDADRIAEEIIRRRRTQPFTSIEELKTTLYSYSDSIRKCEKYITAASKFFTIKVTATSGVAKASSAIAITKEGKTVKRIAVISD